MPDIMSGIAAVCAAVGLTFCGPPPSKPTPPPVVPEVSIVTLRPQSAPLQIDLVGRTTPLAIAEVRPQVNGIIQQRLFEEGAEVKQGDLLYQIDPASYQAAYESAAAALARSEATLASLQSKAYRQQELVKRDYTSKELVEEAQANLSQQQAEIAASRAAVNAAAIDLARTKITAPISGRIGRSSLTQGALVTANQTTALATIQQLDPIYVDVTQSSADLLRLRRELKAGNVKASDTVPVSITLEDGTQYDQKGTLQFADVTVSETTGSVVLRAVVPNPDRILLPGMYVRARLDQGMRENVLLVPQRGVTRDSRGIPTTLVVTPDNKVEMRKLMVTRTLGDAWIVADGVSAGDRVIVEGLQKVKVGQQVSTVQAPDYASARPPESGEPTLARN